MRRDLRGATGLVLTATLAVLLVGTIGLVRSAGLIMAAPDGSAVAVDAGVAPVHDPAKPTVAVLLGETRTEATDFLAPYAMFAASEAYNVYAVASTPAVRTLAGGVDVLPQLTFAQLADRVPAGPDVIVVPAITQITSAENAPVLEWLRQEQEGATLFAWCVGAEVLAAGGLVDGRRVTTHWGDIDGLEAAYPAPDWQRGLRYVDEGDLLTTGGITSGVDATLHFLATRVGQATADRVAAAVHYPETAFLDDPTAPQYTLEPVDAAVYLHLAFHWPKPATAVWVYDGVGELDLAAAVEVFGVTAVAATTTVATTPVVTSEHGLRIVPRRQAASFAAADQVLVPGGVGVQAAVAWIPGGLLGGRPATVLADPDAPRYAFATAIEALAASDGVVIAHQAARQLEVRLPLLLVGPRGSVPVAAVIILAAVGGAVGHRSVIMLVRPLRAAIGRQSRG